MWNEETYAFVRAHRGEDVRRLALRRPPAGVDLHLALQQIEGWQSAVHKLPSWAAAEGIWFPPRLAMEQCSSERTARYKQGVVRRWLERDGIPRPRTMMDLTGGFGIDFSFLAGMFDHAVYMERQSALCRIAVHNFAVLGLRQAEVREVDSASSPQDWPEVDFCYVDPARRDRAGRKVAGIADCEPDLSTLQEVIRQKAGLCMVKLSPMLDVKSALDTLEHVAEVHAVSVCGECKELLLVQTRCRPDGLVFHCVDLGNRDSDYSFTPEEEAKAPCVYADGPGRFLYEPHASVMKCGGFRSLACRYGLRKLHPHSHLYTSDEWKPDFPGRGFVVEACGGFGKKEMKGFLQDIRQANLTVRNFPDTVAGLRKRLKLKEGGEAYLFATTLAGGRHVLLRCRKPL